MSDPVIQARGLSKVYRLYTKPRYRFLDMFGLLRKTTGAYTELAALDRVDLTIRRGEKVAIIGRNGAGKSTFLKLVSGVIEPSGGEIDVVERVHALLSIGTGFHPDFTGRENVYSYLAQLGVTGKEAHQKLDEIIEFAELEDYIDQPIKTYSTGMGVRLMFSTSTSITPDILVLDEVLGVGDAYFTQKSYDRIRDLCEGQGTTLLLVTHDLYSAMKICTRVIWIDKGTVILDSDAQTVVNRYEASIRDQEEQRLRKIMMRAVKENLRRTGTEEEGTIPFFGHVRAQGNVPVDCDVPIRRLTLRRGDDVLASIAPGTEETGDGIMLSLTARKGNWGEPAEIDGAMARCFRTSGSIYHRAPFIIQSAAFAAAIEQGDIELQIEFKDTPTTPLIVDVFHADGARCLLGEVGNAGTGGWLDRRVPLVATSSLETAKPRFNRYGSQLLSITNVVFLDDREEESLTYATGDRMIIRLHYKIHDPTFCEKPVVQVNFLVNGVTRSHRFTLDSVLFDYEACDEGVLEIVADPLLLGPGEYLVNVVAMREGGYDRDAKTKFFTANEQLLDHHCRAYQIVVKRGENALANDVVFLHPATWRRDGKTVYDGVYPLDGAPETGICDGGVPARIDAARAALLDLVRALAIEGSPALPAAPRRSGADDDDDAARLRATFEDLALVTDSGSGAWEYAEVGGGAGLDAARELGFAARAVDRDAIGGAAPGTFGAIGCWGQCTGAAGVEDTSALAASLAPLLADAGVLAFTMPNPRSPGARLTGDGAPLLGMNELEKQLDRAGLAIIDVQGEAANDYIELLDTLAGSEGAANADDLRRATELSRALLGELAEPLRIMDHLAIVSPTIRVLACRKGDVGRLAPAIERIRIRRGRRLYESTLSSGLHPEVDETEVYLDPPHIADSEELFRADVVAIDPHDLAVRHDIVEYDGERMTIAGAADAPHSYLVKTGYMELPDDFTLVLQGELRRGGFTIGLLKDEQWANQLNVTTRGPFRVAMQVAHGGSYSVVLANCLPENELETDFELSRIGIVESRHSAAT